MFIKRKKRFSWRAKLIGAVALVLVPCGVVYVLGVFATHKWERYAEKIREGGMPLTYEEVLKHQSELPDGPTAADVIAEQCEALRDLRRSERGSRLLFFDARLPTVDLTVGIPEYSIEPTRELLSRNQELLDELLAVADLPAGRLPAPRTSIRTSSQFVWETVAAQNAVMLLQNHAVMSIASGDPTEAARSVRSQLRVVETFDEYPTHSSQLRQFGAWYRTLPSIEGMLHAMQLDAPTIETLSIEIESRRRASTLKWVLLGQRAWWVETCEQLLNGDLKLSTFHHGPAPPWEWTPTWLFRRDQLRGAEIFTQFLEMGDDIPRMLNVAQQADRKANPSLADWPLLVIGSMGMSDAVTFHAWNVAQLRSTHAGLAVERFRMATGRFPDSLDALVPEYLDAVPVDPFDGKPLRLATTEKGIVIYSVFDNLIDDGGDVAQTEKRARTPDIGFRLARPEHRGIVLLDDPPPEPYPSRGPHGESD